MLKNVNQNHKYTKVQGGVFFYCAPIFFLKNKSVLDFMCDNNYNKGVTERGDSVTQVGRPKTEKPKSNRFSIRLDDETEQKLEAYCKEHNITKGEAIRQGIHLLLKKKK